MEDVPFTAQRRADFFNSLIFKFVYFFTYTHGGRSIYSAAPCRAGFCTFLRLRSAMSNTFFFFIIMHYITFHTKSAFFFISSFGDVNDLPPPLICCSLNAKR